MSHPNDELLIDRLADLAASRRVPKGGDPDALLREAAIVGRARVRATQRRRTLAALGGVGVALLALVALAWPRPAAPSAAIETLALGPHTIATASGTALAVEALGEETAIRVDGGRALFDVAPLPEGGSFVVSTPDASVRVVGTVFSVAFVEEHTEVEVFEGIVEVEQGGERRRLEAGERLDAAGRDDAVVALIRERGARAAAARATEASRSSGGPSDEAASDRADRAETDDAAHADGSEPRGAASDPDDPAASSTERDVDPADLEAHALRDRSSAPSIDLATLRALCDRGEFAAALAALEGARPPRAERGEWALLEGDAARATGDLRRAATAYERAADALSPSRAALAGFLAATSHERQGQHERALAVLERTRAAERGSPLEERALAMRADLLARLGRTQQAHEAARRYLASFPGGEATARMEALLP